jgi:HD-like signal output (HDOD) protein
MNEEINETKTLPVGVGSLTSGMVLAENLFHLNGRLILKEGTRLTPENLRVIKMWGITEAKILSAVSREIDREAFAEEAFINEKAAAAAEELFLFTDSQHEVIRELIRLFLKRYSPKNEMSRLTVSKPVKLVKPINIREKIKKDIILPSLPDIVIHINDAIRNPNCTATLLAGIINKDSNLTARLLKLVNSAVYSFPLPIQSIGRAVTIVGLRQLSSLAVATAVTSTFKNIPPEIIDMKSFWKHSLACGTICRLLASYKKNIHNNTESYFLAGLLHDIGRLVIYQYFPMLAQEALSQAQSNPHLLREVEPKLFGDDHTELGNILIQQWRLPSILEYACHFHHSPLKSPDKLVASITHVADIISYVMRFGSSGEYYVPPLEPGAWEQIGLPVSVLSPIMKQADAILEETLQTYLDYE